MLMERALHVLHVEDCVDDGELLRMELEAAGYALHYRRVETGDELEAALAAENWDLIISDFNLPSFTAYEVLRLLKASGRDIPLIVVSGFIGEEGAVALMKAGAHDYVMKDNLSRLAPAIEREMKEAASRRQRRQADQALAASQKLLQNITAALGEGLLVVDNDSRLILMNAEAERPRATPKTRSLSGRTAAHFRQPMSPRRFSKANGSLRRSPRSRTSAFASRPSRSCSSRAASCRSCPLSCNRCGKTSARASRANCMTNWARH
jgi:DNA-binding response OmpR family regulator